MLKFFADPCKYFRINLRSLIAVDFEFDQLAKCRVTAAVTEVFYDLVNIFFFHHVPASGEHERFGVGQAHGQQFFDDLLDHDGSHKSESRPTLGFRSAAWPYVARAVRHESERVKQLEVRNVFSAHNLITRFNRLQLDYVFGITRLMREYVRFNKGRSRLLKTRLYRILFFFYF